MGVEEQLFAHFEQAGMEDGTWPQEGVTSLETTMKMWTNQAGFPLVEAMRGEQGNSSSVSHGMDRRRGNPTGCGISPSTGWRLEQMLTGRTPVPVLGSLRKHSEWSLSTSPTFC